MGRGDSVLNRRPWNKAELQHLVRDYPDAPMDVPIERDNIKSRPANGNRRGG